MAATFRAGKRRPSFAATLGVDAWAAQARDGRGDDATTPRLVRDAVAALLGVEL